MTDPNPKPAPRHEGGDKPAGKTVPADPTETGMVDEAEGPPEPRGGDREGGMIGEG